MLSYKNTLANFLATCTVGSGHRFLRCCLYRGGMLQKKCSSFCFFSPIDVASAHPLLLLQLFYFWFSLVAHVHIHTYIKAVRISFWHHDQQPLHPQQVSMGNISDPSQKKIKKNQVYGDRGNSNKEREKKSTSFIFLLSLQSQ